jgi:hypothetical protein
MRYVIALLVGAHGIAHLVGFAVAWRLIATIEAPYKTTLLGGLVDMGHGGVRIVGLLWYATAVACVIAGAALWDGAGWSAQFATYVLLFSLTLCLTALPEARIGVIVNLSLLTGFLTPGLRAALLPF